MKALLPWRGQSLLEHQVWALREGGVDRVVVVVGHRAEELIPLVESRKGAAWVLNPDYMQGKTTSIRTGLSALDADAVSETAECRPAPFSRGHRDPRHPPVQLLTLNVDHCRRVSRQWCGRDPGSHRVSLEPISSEHPDRSHL